MSKLVERVKAAISETSSSFYSLPADNPEWMLHHAQARAAIAAVAEWLKNRDKDHWHSAEMMRLTARKLEEQLEQPK